jgi:hypothetical protein
MILPGPYFLAFEAVVLATFVVCLRHAWLSGPAQAWALCAGVLFGLLLEWATIQQLNAYAYGRFLLMLGEVPLAIGVAWGVILYTARLFSDATSLPGWARPVLDALLGLNLDLALDAVAIRLGFWDWGGGFSRWYFGVPYENFWAWFWVVFSFSAGLRLLSRWRHPAGAWLAPAGAVVIGVAGVLATNAFITGIQSEAASLGAIAAVLGGALVLMLALRPRLHVRPVPRLAAWAPLVFHAYFLAAGLISGAILRPPFLLLVSLAMIAVALALHGSILWAAGWRAVGRTPGSVP